MTFEPSMTIAPETRWTSLLSKSREELLDALCDVPRKPEAMVQNVRINEGREGGTP